MFNGLKQKVLESLVSGTLKNLATNPDTKTSITGLIAAVILAVPGFNLHLLLSGNPLQIAHTAAALLVVLIGFWCTKVNHDGHTSFAGAAAGALYASSGQVQDIATGVVLFLVGYFTNKPVLRPGDKM